MITGVAAGLSDSLGLNVYLFRARFLVVALLTKGIGVIPYILIGLLLSMDKRKKQPERKPQFQPYILIASLSSISRCFPTLN
jgi:phage shock protein PspC (stress-responsive transcriptional regulator)